MLKGSSKKGKLSLLPQVCGQSVWTLLCVGATTRMLHMPRLACTKHVYTHRHARTGRPGESPSSAELERHLLPRVLTIRERRGSGLTGSAGRPIPGAPLASAARLGHSSRSATASQPPGRRHRCPAQPLCSPSGPAARSTSEASRLEDAEFSRNFKHCFLTNASSPAAHTRRHTLREAEAEQERPRAPPDEGHVLRHAAGRAVEAFGGRS